MIINPTHEITLSGLPSDVLDAYVRYKKGSRAIVTWLVKFGPESYKGARTLPIKELSSLAQKVANKITVLPDVIDFHFRETIAARKCLSKFFRDNRDVTVDDFDTVNHEHFTSSLNDIYKGLCEKCQASKAVVRARQLRTYQKNVATSIRNHYDCLPVEQIQGLEEALAHSTIDCEDCKDEVQISCSGMKNEIDLEGDDVGVAIENVYLFDCAQSIFKAVEHYWSIAGAGHISLIAAAGATNAAWQMLLDIEVQLKSSNPDTTLKSLHRRTCILQHAVSDTNAFNGPSKQHDLLRALETSENSLKHYIEGPDLKVISSCASCIQKPADYIKPLQDSQIEEPESFQIALLDNILRLINRAGNYPSLVLSGSPCLTELGCLLSHIRDNSCIFKSVLNTHLLVTSYKSYMNACVKPFSVSMCRVIALKIAQQAASSVQTVLADKHAFPCQCPQTLAYHLTNLEHNLSSYAKHKCWDLYFQSPWVTGTHIIEMLDMLDYYGMRLFHYRHHVGSILHTYNVLQQLGGLDAIVPLEKLCDLFQDLFFPAAGRPSSSFRNSWSRFVGARLRFKRGHRAANHRENWCMAIPAHAARAAAGLGTNGSESRDDEIDPKFDFGRYSPLIKLKQQNYRQSMSAWESTFERKKRSSSASSSSLSSSYSSRPASSHSVPTQSSASSIESSSSIEKAATPPTPASSSSQDDGLPQLKSHHPLLDIVNQLDNDINPPSATDDTKYTFPPATKLNLLAVFATCTKIVSKISDRTHTSPNDKDIKNCICFTTTLLAGADRITQGRKLGRLEAWKKHERDLIEIVGSVLTEVMADIEKDHCSAWTWDI